MRGLRLWVIGSSLTEAYCSQNRRKMLRALIRRATVSCRATGMVLIWDPTAAYEGGTT